MNYFENSFGVNVKEDWDTFWWEKLNDYYRTQEFVVGVQFTATVENGVVDVVCVGDQVEQAMQVLRSTRFLDVIRTINKHVFVGTVVFADGYYKLQEDRVYLLGLYDNRRETTSRVDVDPIVEQINMNAYGSKFYEFPKIGMARFTEALERIKKLPDDGEGLEQIESDVAASLLMLVDNEPSLINPVVPKVGVVMNGVFGYTFNYLR